MAVRIRIVHLGAELQGSAGVDDDLDDLEPAGRRGGGDRRFELTGALDQGMTGAGGERERSEIGVVRRDEEFAVLRQIALGQQREDLATAVAHERRA